MGAKINRRKTPSTYENDESITTVDIDMSQSGLININSGIKQKVLDKFRNDLSNQIDNKFSDSVDKVLQQVLPRSSELNQLVQNNNNAMEEIRTLVEDKVLNSICNIPEELSSSEEAIKETINRNLEELKNNSQNIHEKIAQSILTSLTEWKQQEDDIEKALHAESLKHLEQQLYDVTHTTNIDEDNVLYYARKLCEFEPDHVLGNFYKLVSENKDNVSIVNDYLDKVDITSVEHDDICAMLDYLIEPLEPRMKRSLCYLVELAYQHNVFNRGEYNEYVTKIEEARSFDRLREWDLFVAYSSADLSEVNKLVDKLERLGISCFVSYRDIPRGREGSNYWEFLKCAMDNSSGLVFVSTPNSRSRSCNAIQRPRSQEGEIVYFCENYPEDKKCRIEYRPNTDRIDDTEEEIVKALIKKLFGEVTYCTSADTVAATFQKHYFKTMRRSGDSGPSSERTTAAEPKPTATMVKPAESADSKQNAQESVNIGTGRSHNLTQEVSKPAQEPKSVSATSLERTAEAEPKPTATMVKPAQSADSKQNAQESVNIGTGRSHNLTKEVSKPAQEPKAVSAISPEPTSEVEPESTATMVKPAESAGSEQNAQESVNIGTGQSREMENFHLINVIFSDTATIEQKWHAAYAYLLRIGTTDFDVVKNWFEKAAGKDSPMAQYGLGCWYYDVMQNYDEAIKWLKNVINNRTATVEHKEKAIHMLGNCYCMLQRYDDAGKCYEQSKNIANKKLDAVRPYALGMYYYCQKAYAEALKWFLQDEKHQVDNVKLGNCYWALGDQTKAVECYIQTEGLASISLGAEEQFAIAKYYHEQKNNMTAVKWFNRAAQLGHAEAQYDGGNCYYELKDYSNAIVWFNKVINNATAKSELKEQATYMMGNCYYKKENYRNAIVWFNRVINNATAKSELKEQATYMVGNCYWALGEQTKAVECYIQTEDLASISLGAEEQFAIGKYYDEQSNNETAVKWLKKSADQGCAEAQFMLGEYSYDNGQLDEAIIWFQKAQDRDENKEPETYRKVKAFACCWLGQCYEEKYEDTDDESDKGKAERYYRKAADRIGEPDAAQEAKCALKKLGVPVQMDLTESKRKRRWFGLKRQVKRKK